MGCLRYVLRNWELAGWLAGWHSPILLNRLIFLSSYCVVSYQHVYYRWIVLALRTTIQICCLHVYIIPTFIIYIHTNAYNIMLNIIIRQKKKLDDILFCAKLFLITCNVIWFTSFSVFILLSKCLNLYGNWMAGYPHIGTDGSALKHPYPKNSRLQKSIRQNSQLGGNGILRSNNKLVLPCSKDA